MTESSDLSRSGLDMPEGSANADKVEETGLVDTNADSHRNPVSSDSGDGGGDGGETPPPETPDESPEHQPAQEQAPEPAPQQ